MYAGSIPLGLAALLFSLPFGRADEIGIDCSQSSVSFASISDASYDLTTLAGEHTAKRTRDTPPTIMEDDLLFNICADLKPRENIPEKDQCPPGTRACLTKVNRKNDEDRILSVIALASSPQVNVSSFQQSGISMAFKQGQEYPSPIDLTPLPQFLTVHVVCNQDSTTDPKFVSYDGSHAVVEWSNKAGCAINKDGSGGGSDKDSDKGGETTPAVRSNGIGWFFLVLVLAFITYFAVGAYYNYATYGASGADLIPHRDFWREVPFMCRDVVSHLCSSVRPRQHASRSGYISV